LKWTLPSIQKNIIEPARVLGETRLFAHFFQQELIINPRTKEDQSLDLNEYQLLECDEVELEKPGSCLTEANYEWVLAHGDAFFDEGKSLANLIHQLRSLLQVGRMIDRWEPDVVILARPDLMYHESLHDEIAKQVNRSNIYLSVPNWQWFGGVNDRFAIGSRESCRAYTKRFEYIQQYIEKTGGPLPAERFLRFCLKQQGIIPRPIPITASRVRSNGRVVEEDFSPISTGKYLKRTIESIFSYLRKLTK
jgi:hypothetical protein